MLAKDIVAMTGGICAAADVLGVDRNTVTFWLTTKAAPVRPVAKLVWLVWCALRNPDRYAHEGSVFRQTALESSARNARWKARGARKRPGQRQA